MACNRENTPISNTPGDSKNINTEMYTNIPSCYDMALYTDDEKELSKPMLTLWDFGDPVTDLGDQTQSQLFTIELQEMQVTLFSVMSIVISLF